MSQMTMTMEEKPSGRISFSRKRRPHLSSYQVEQIEVEGETLLFLSPDHSWLQGSIVGDEDSSYSLIGDRVLLLEDNNNNTNEKEDDLSFTTTLTDHFTGLSYNLPKIQVHLDPKSPSLLTNPSGEAQVRFKVDSVYKGQKADMKIQRLCGNESPLIGKNCWVYDGHISLLFSDRFVNSGRDWCL